MGKGVFLVYICRLCVSSISPKGSPSERMLQIHCDCMDNINSQPLVFHPILSVVVGSLAVKDAFFSPLFSESQLS